MQIFEPHAHMYSRTVDDYDKMSLAGVTTIVEPSFWLGSERNFPETYFDYFKHILEFEPQRAMKYGITHYSCISINPKEANNKNIALKVIEGLSTYLDHPKCIAIGEIGLDKGTVTEEEILRLQLQIAKKKDMLVMIHTPHLNKKAGAERIIEILREEEMNPEKILIDHNTEETIALSLRYGAWAGMTIYPGKVSPESALKILQTYGTDQMMINSSCDWAISDPLAVPKTCRKMKEEGFSENEIKKVVWGNPFSFYSLSGKLN